MDIENGSGEGNFLEESAGGEATPAAGEQTPVAAEPAAGALDAGNGGEATPAYAPNFGFKVMDQAHEIPEQFRSLIKDADTEKQVREIFEKAYGLDHVKPKYESTRKELDMIRSEYEPIKKDLTIIGELLKNQDYGAFFEAFGLTNETIVKHAMDILEYHQLPPEKQQAWDAQKQRNLQYVQQQQELNGMKAQQAQAQVENTYQELKSSVSQPHIQGIAESFNSRAGQPDAFEKAVIAHAQNHFALHKQDLTVPQAVESFIRTFGLSAAASQHATPAAAPASANPADRKATLPRPGSGTVSPVKPKVKSLDDLRALQKEAYASGHGERQS